MGDNRSTLMEVRTGGVDKRVSKYLQGYMTMGESGMAGMGEMGMPVPHNSIPKVGAPGKHGYIDIGGLFTILKSRDNLTNYQYPGWDQNPPGTRALLPAREGV